MRVGIIVPTLCERGEWTVAALKSIRESGADFVVIVTPERNRRFFEKDGRTGLWDKLVFDEGLGQVAAIQMGIDALDGYCDYFNWVNDDDELLPGALTVMKSAIEETLPSICFGNCEYIREDGTTLGQNKLGPLAIFMVGWGPDLVPSPSCLFSFELAKSLGGVNLRAGLAVDYDLIIRLARAGRTKYVNQLISKFRWHQGSLTVSKRHLSVIDASKARLRNLPPVRMVGQVLIEPLVIASTYLAGVFLSLRARL